MSILKSFAKFFKHQEKREVFWKAGVGMAAFTVCVLWSSLKGDSFSEGCMHFLQQIVTSSQHPPININAQLGN